jgi:hypothetical protein
MSWQTPLSLLINRHNKRFKKNKKIKNPTVREQAKFRENVERED